MFTQAHYQLYMANTSVTQHGDPEGLNYTQPDGSVSGGVYQWQQRRTAYMIAHVADVIEKTRGPNAQRPGPSGRWRPVLAGQVMGTPQMEGLRYLWNSRGIAPDSKLHATANAPYFAIWPAKSAGRTSKNCWSNLTEADVLEGL